MTYAKNIDRLRDSWEEAHSILVHFANKVMADRRLDLAIEEPRHPKPSGNLYAVLRKANQRFHRHLGRLEEFFEDLGVDSDDLKPWCFGERLLSLKDPVSELGMLINIMTDRTDKGDFVLNWTKAECQSEFVLPMRHRAEICRKRLDDLLERAEERQLSSEPAATEGATQPKPSWKKDEATLFYKGVVIRSIRSISIAANVVKVLDAFEEEGWPVRIDDPLDPSKNQQRLHECIKRLNDKLEDIRFSADGTGQGIRWKPL